MSIKPYDFSVPESAVPLDIDSLYFDLSVNYRDIRWDRVKASIGYELSEDTAVVSEYDKDGALRSLAKADRTVAFYDGKGNVLEVTDIHGDAIVSYTYDEAGVIIGLNMAQARRDADIKLAEMKFRISEEKKATIYEITKQSDENIQAIKAVWDNTASPLYTELNRLQGLYNANENKKIHWWQWGAKEEKNRTRDSYQAAMQIVRNQISDLNNRKAADIAAYESQVADLLWGLNTEGARAIDEVTAKNKELLDQISVQEARPVIQEHYRVILGRDPGEKEVELWLNTVRNSSNHTLDVSALNSSLRDSTDPQSEYNRRTANIAWVRGEVENRLRAYLEMTTEEKEAFLKTLNLTSGDAVPITADDLTKIMDWLSSQNPHFGRSASNVIGEFLKAKGATYEDKELVKLAILIDVLTGTITRFTQGKLLISAFALKKIALKYGVELTPVKISLEALAALVPVGSGKKAVVFLGDKHYVVLESIDISKDQVTYRETSKGPQGEAVTLKVADFLETWKGNYALIEGTPPKDETRVLTDYEAKKIRGACFVELFYLIFVIFQAVAQIIAAIVTAIIAIVQAIVIPLVQGIIQAGVSLIANFISGIASAIGVSIPDEFSI